MRRLVPEEDTLVSKPLAQDRAITIGRLARCAGVTVKAVRHYHRRGLLDEPPRDAAGYRRYGAEHAIALVKIKTLADAGVPLARVKELLAADSDRFAAAIADIRRDLLAKADKLLQSRERVGRLDAGDRLFVSADVADYLDDLRALGVSGRTVTMERNVWVLLQSISPADAAAWITEKREAIVDPAFRGIYLDYDAAFAWSPDDPRLEGLVDRTERWLARRARASTRRASSVQPAVAKLVAGSVGACSPAWGQLTTRIRERALARAGRRVDKGATRA